MPERPWFQFHPSDWLGDTDLQACTLAAKGLWADCLALMHTARPRGHLVLRGKPLDVPALALAVRRPVKEVRVALAELDEARVFSRTEDGVIYSRRMVRDTKKQEQNTENGRLGGSPALKPSVNPSSNGSSDKASDKANADATRLVSGSSGSGVDLDPASDDRPEPSNAESDRFERFWASYPRHTNKAGARAKWLQKHISEALTDIIIAAVEAQKLGRQWLDGVYPHASTWLHQERWNDEIEPVRGGLNARVQQQKVLAGVPKTSGETWRERCARWGHHPVCQVPVHCEIKQRKLEQDEADEA